MVVINQNDCPEITEQVMVGGIIFILAHPGM